MGEEITCPHCNAEINAYLDICPVCQVNIFAKKKKGKNVEWVGGGLLVLSLCFILSFWFIFPFFELSNEFVFSMLVLFTLLSLSSLLFFYGPAFNEKDNRNMILFIIGASFGLMGLINILLWLSEVSI